MCKVLGFLPKSEEINKTVNETPNELSLNSQFMDLQIHGLNAWHWTHLGVVRIQQKIINLPSIRNLALSLVMEFLSFPFFYWNQNILCTHTHKVQSHVTRKLHDALLILFPNFKKAKMSITGWFSVGDSLGCTYKYILTASLDKENVVLNRFSMTFTG